MLPYLIGAILLFGAVNLTVFIANQIDEGSQGDNQSPTPTAPSGGRPGGIIDMPY